MSSVQLLQVRETLQSNLTGSQITGVLDGLLHHAPLPLYRYTEYVQQVVAELLLVVQYDHRRRLTNSSRPASLRQTFGFLTVGRSRRGWQHFLNTRWQRQVLVDLNQRFLNTRQEPAAAVAERYGCSVERLQLLYRWVASCMDYYHTFKNRVIEKYIRYAYNETARSLHGTKLHIDFDDLLENLLLGVDQAIGKYDSRRATLTSCINQWLRNAKTNPKFDHVYEQSYRVSSTHRRTMSARLEAGTSSEQSWSTSLDRTAGGLVDPTPNAEQRLVAERDVAWWNRLLNSTPELRLLKLSLETPYQPEVLHEAATACA